MKKPKHTTTTESARRAVKALAKIGVVAYPGIIDPKGGKTTVPIVTIKSHENRVVIVVAKSGVQELAVYGSTDVDDLSAALTAEFDDGIVKVS